HDLRPVDHRRKDKVEGVGAQFQGAAVGGGQAAAGQVQPFKEIAHHGQGLGGGHDGGFRVSGQEGGDAGAVVRLHVVDNQVVGLAAVQHGGQVGEPFLGEVDVHGVQHGHLLVQDHIGVVG